MARPRKVDRPIPISVKLPESLHRRLTLLLHSDAEGRVPYGEWSRFFCTLAEQALARLTASSSSTEKETPHALP